MRFVRFLSLTILLFLSLDFVRNHLSSLQSERSFLSRGIQELAFRGQGIHGQADVVHQNEVTDCFRISLKRNINLLFTGKNR